MVKNGNALNILIILYFYIKQMEIDPIITKQLEENNKHIYKSTQDENIRYHLGIIDYL